MFAAKRVVRAASSAALALFALTGSPRPAAACGACVCDSAEAPRPILDLIRDLPLNLSVPLRVLDEAEPPPRLERVADGVPAPVTVKRVTSTQNYWLLTVDQDLEPNTEYRIMRNVGVEAQFTTGAARDADVPTLTGVVSTPGGNADLCDKTVGAHVKLAGADDGTAFNVWVELEVDIDNTAHPLFTDYANGDVRLGHSAMGCLGDNELPQLADNTGYPSRLRLHDAAGNTSPWGTFILDVATDDPAGCGTPSPVAGASGIGASNSGGTSAINTSGGASDEPEAPTRTSKGCGCALGQRQRGPWAGCMLLASMFAAAIVRRRTR